MFTDAERLVTVVAPADDLILAGPALSMWFAVRRRDAGLGTILFETFTPTDLVGAAASLAVSLLAEAGRHGYQAHEEVRRGELQPGHRPYSVPNLVNVGPDDDYEISGPGSGEVPGLECPCRVAAAAGMLRPVVYDTVAFRPLEQIGDQFDLDPLAEHVTLTDVSAIELATLLEASGLLLARRWHTDRDEIFAWASKRVLAAAA